MKKNKIAKTFIFDLETITKIENMAKYKNMSYSCFLNTLIKRLNIADFNSVIEKIELDNKGRKTYTLDENLIEKLGTFAEYHNTKAAPFLNQLIKDITEKQFIEIFKR